ncbi:MAG: carboxypeptidase-like regulatory domain-containing protein [Bacteroidota bacterium]
MVKPFWPFLFLATVHLGLFTHAQTATITGLVLGSENVPLPLANVSANDIGTSTDSNGFYVLQVPADTPITLRFSHLGHKDVVIRDLILTTNATYAFNPVLKMEVIHMDGVTVTPKGERNVEGITLLTPKEVQRIPGANPGVENILKLLPSVSSNNELSTQYAVRGGNYDENLVYINEIEVYRPFLLRSAQQEGLSFVNSDMTQRVKFAAGGFQAKYGDKMSSVLDITYKNPAKSGALLNASFLGANAVLETVSKNKNFTAVSGLRYRNNALLVNSMETKANFNPVFVDAQSYMTYRFSKQFQLGFLGNISLNDYNNEPLNRETTFGTLQNPRTLTVFYQGRENNTYATQLAALKGDYHLDDKTTLKLISSIYHTTEEEYSDVLAQYRLGETETNLGGETQGGATFYSGLGGQFNRARNDLDALIVNFQHKGVTTHGNQVLEWGIQYTREDIRDQIRESEFIDSAGFLIRPPLREFGNNQPREPFTAPLVPFESLNAQNFVQTDRFSGFLQLSNRKRWKRVELYYNLGLRAQHWTVRGDGLSRTSQVVISPRAQVALKPFWEKDMLFRLSAGVYQQPPFYRELRDSTGRVRPEVKAQRSFHLVAGHEYSFALWNRPFTLIAEAYYKHLDNVNPYTLEDVRIRYRARNNAEAYALGAEMRLSGAFVPGTESWISLGYLKTEENIDRRGYISRPSDQRFNLGILFQDYIPNLPSLRMYLNLVYNTGVPGGSPSYADPYVFQNRLRDYRRADLGISYIFVTETKTFPKGHWLNPFKGLSAGFEVFNLFNNQNSITNTWVRDVESKQQFAIPNFMTSRVFNLRLSMRF